MYIVSLTSWKNEYTIGNRWLLGVYFFCMVDLITLIVLITTGIPKQHCLICEPKRRLDVNTTRHNNAPKIDTRIISYTSYGIRVPRQQTCTCIISYTSYMYSLRVPRQHTCITSYSLCSIYMYTSALIHFSVLYTK